MNIVSVTHNAGFFSNCSVKLHEIIHFINRHKQFPLLVDSSKQFEWYKINKTDDITYDYFEHYDKTEPMQLPINIKIYFNFWTYQFVDYNKIIFNSVCPIVRKYFSPSKEIINIIKNIEDKYKINYENLCVLFYRGNDKNRETKICGYHIVQHVVKRIVNQLVLLEIYHEDILIEQL